MADEKPTPASENPEAPAAASDKGGYNASMIKSLDDVDHVRTRPGMYIGGYNPRGLHHLVYEIVDNSIDEALAGFARHVEVRINPDGSCTVTDDGRGIPVDTHPDTGLPAVEMVFASLATGGKFEHDDDSAYKPSGGLHGVGASVVNFVSEWLEVEVSRDGKIHQMATCSYCPAGVRVLFVTTIVPTIAIRISGNVTIGCIEVTHSRSRCRKNAAV